MHPEYPLGLFVRGALAHLTPEFDAPGPGCSQTSLDPIPDQIPLELGQAGHELGYIKIYRI